ncbi:MAG: hypothetical protein V3W28_07745, partial [Thermoplasmata archaeon]
MAGASVQAAAAGGPYESLGCDGRRDHHLEHVPISLLEERTTCKGCGQIWTRSIYRVDKNRVLHRAPDPFYKVQRPERTSQGARRGAVVEDEMPRSFSELEALRRERQEDL